MAPSPIHNNRESAMELQTIREIRHSFEVRIEAIKVSGP
jgi:hypothetical protein